MHEITNTGRQLYTVIAFVQGLNYLKWHHSFISVWSIAYPVFTKMQGLNQFSHFMKLNWWCGLWFLQHAVWPCLSGPQPHRPLGSSGPQTAADLSLPFLQEQKDRDRLSNDTCSLITNCLRWQDAKWRQHTCLSPLIFPIMPCLCIQFSVRTNLNANS